MDEIEAVKIEDHLGLVISIAYKARRRATRTFDYEDMVSAGYIGLILAAKKFNPERGKSFEAFAARVIKGTIQNHIRDFGGLTLKIPRREREIINSIRFHDMERWDDEAIAKQLKMPLELVRSARESSEVKLSSIDFAPDPNSPAFEEVIPAPCDPSEREVEEFIGTLTPEERIAVRLSMAGKTQREIASVLGGSQMRVSRILKQVGRKYQLAQ